MYRQILLVGKDQEKSISQFILIQHALELLTGLHNTITIIAIDNKDNALSVLEVMPPQWSDLILSPHIPYSELDVPVFNRFDVKS